jgi:orotidine-5'-phosphate decarboxylase
MTPKDRLIIALDVDSYEKASELVDRLSPVVDIFKVGIAPFTDFGEKIIDKLHKTNKKIFLDLKYHDIPNTVKNAAAAAAKKGIFMMNFHCLGGKKMLEAAVKGAEEAAGGKRKRPILLGVTVLTSMDDGDLGKIGMAGSVKEKVMEFAKLALEAGLDGVVGSAEETAGIKKLCGKDFIVVTPGIRPLWSESGDQKRVVSPSEAVANGSDYIVVGRPVIEADDPRETVAKIIEEMELKGRKK